MVFSVVNVVILLCLMYTIYVEAMRVADQWIEDSIKAEKLEEIAVQRKWETKDIE